MYVLRKDQERKWVSDDELSCRSLYKLTNFWLSHRSLSLFSLYFFHSLSLYNLYRSHLLLSRLNSIGKVITSILLSNTTNHLAFSLSLSLSLLLSTTEKNGLKRNESTKINWWDIRRLSRILCSRSYIFLSRSLLTFRIISMYSLSHILRTWRVIEQLHTNIKLFTYFCCTRSSPLTSRSSQ